MTRGCRIGLAGRAAASAALRRRARLAGPLAGGRLELAVPPLAAQLLVRRSRRVPSSALFSRHTELRLAPVTILGRGAPAPAASVVSAAPLQLARPPASAPAAAAGVAPTPGTTAPSQPRDSKLPASAASPSQAPPLQMRVIRETLRERVEHTVERALARGRRDEPAARSTTPGPILVPSRGTPPVSAPPVFPKLVLPAPVPALAAAVARVHAAEPPLAPARSSARMPDEAPRREAAPQAGALPQLVDAVVGELDRRIRAQRERNGWLA